MRTAARPRRYLPAPAVALSRPLLHYSQGRQAYVLRLVGNRVGPVLRIDRRRSKLPYTGVERRLPRANHGAPQFWPPDDLRGLSGRRDREPARRRPSGADGRRDGSPH